MMTLHIITVILVLSLDWYAVSGNHNTFMVRPDAKLCSKDNDCGRFERCQLFIGCSQGQCVCETGYTTYSTPGTPCKRLPLETCDKHGDCAYEYDGSRCTNGTCSCPKWAPKLGLDVNGTEVCMQYALGDECDSPYAPGTGGGCQQGLCERQPDNRRKCKCRSSQVEAIDDQGNKICRTPQLGEACTSYCSTSYSQCVNGKCICRTTTTEETVDGQKHCRMPGYGEKCKRYSNYCNSSQNLECKTSSSYGYDGICKCRYQAEEHTVNGTIVCKYKSLGDNCSGSSECRGGPYMRCMNSVCQCSNSFVENENGMCSRVKHGDSCYGLYSDKECDYPFKCIGNGTEKICECEKNKVYSKRYHSCVNKDANLEVEMLGSCNAVSAYGPIGMMYPGSLPETFRRFNESDRAVCQEGLNCMQCPGTNTSDVDQKSFCTKEGKSKYPCAKGFYSVDKGSECIACEAGSYTDVEGSLSCKKCPAGSYSSVGATECTLCSPGSYQESEGSSSCDFCPKGTFLAISGAESNQCKPCEPGSHATDQGQDSCRPCELGFAQEKAGSESCDMCNAGSYSENIGQEKCQLCPAGTSQPLTGHSLCFECVAGSYTEQEGQTNCTLCTPGTYQDKHGQSSCNKCPKGTYLSEEAAVDLHSCQACPEGYTTENEGASEFKQCIEDTKLEDAMEDLTDLVEEGFEKVLGKF